MAKKSKKNDYSLRVNTRFLNWYDCLCCKRDGFSFSKSGYDRSKTIY